MRFALVVPTGVVVLAVVRRDDDSIFVVGETRERNGARFAGLAAGDGQQQHVETGEPGPDTSAGEAIDRPVRSSDESPVSHWLPD